MKSELCAAAYALTGLTIMGCAAQSPQEQVRVQDLLQNPNVKVKEQFVETPKGKLWVETANLDAKGQCEVYVHGNSAPSIWMGDLVQDRQEQGKCTVRLDLPGHGKSGRAESYSINTMTDALHSVVIDDLHLDARPDGYSVVGWSYGGNINTLAFDQGKLPGVKSIVSVGQQIFDLPNTYNTPSSLRSDTFATEEIIPDAYNLKPDLTDRQLSVMTKGFICHNDEENLENCTVPEDLQQSVRDTDPRVRGAIMDSLKNGEIKNELTILKNRGEGVNACFIWGKYDAFISGEFMEAAKGVVKPEYSATLDTGHAVATEAPKELSKHLDACFSMGMKP